MIALEYAKALYELALKSNKVEDITDEFSAFVEAIKGEEDIIKVLTYPSIKNSNKKEVIKNICASFSDTFLNFLNVLIDNSRFENIFTIYTEYTKVIDEKNNIVSIDAFSMVALSDEEILNLKRLLQPKFKDKKIMIKNIVEPLLIGGIKIVYDGQSIDMSLQNKIDQLKASL